MCAEHCRDSEGKLELLQEYCYCLYYYCLYYYCANYNLTKSNIKESAWKAFGNVQWT